MLTERVFRPGRLLAGVLFLLGAWGSSARSLERFSIDTWPTTTRYLAFAEFPAKADGRIRITAGDKYALYLNGKRVGSDDDPATVETYEVSFRKRTNILAVVVEHMGRNTGYGLFCVLESGDLRLVSSPDDRMTPWFWTDFPLPDRENAAWTKLKLSQLGRHEEDGEAVLWSPVQAGTLDPRAFPGFSDLDLTRARSVAGFPGGLDGSGGSLRLRSLAGQNLAFHAFSDDPKLVDGTISTPVNFRKGAAALLQSVEIDLGRLRTIDRVRVLTQPPSSRGSYEDASLRGYSILVSKDGVNFIEVGARNRIENFRESEVRFPAITAQHVRLVVTEFSNRNASPRVGEMEVYGEGIAQQGAFLSPPIDLGTEALKNFDRVQWFGEVPAEASLELRFRSGDDGETWSDWSGWSADPEIALDVPEPSRFLQFQARMQTRDLFDGPRLDSLVVLYDSGDIPASSAQASVQPSMVPMGVDTTFSYSLDLEVGGSDTGVSRLVVLTPWPARLEIGRIQGIAEDRIDPERTYSTNDSLVLSFEPPLTGSVHLVVPFTTRLLSASHLFRGMLYGPGSFNPLLVRARQGVDPSTGAEYSLAVGATDHFLSVLDQVGAVPPVFSPNGDGINDRVVIGFTLARVFSAPVRIEIYDLAGTRVRTLPQKRLSSGRYARVEGRRLDLPGEWDGRSDEGERVPPGLYLYRIVVDLDPDDEVRSGWVGVVY